MRVQGRYTEHEKISDSYLFRYVDEQGQLVGHECRSKGERWSCHRAHVQADLVKIIRLTSMLRGEVRVSINLRK